MRAAGRGTGRADFCDARLTVTDGSADEVCLLGGAAAFSARGICGFGGGGVITGTRFGAAGVRRGGSVGDIWGGVVFGEVVIAILGLAGFSTSDFASASGVLTLADGAEAIAFEVTLA